MPVTLEFLRVDKVVRVPSPDTLVTIQEIYDQSQDWLDEPGQMNVQHFLSAGGKESLGGVPEEFVGVTLTLVNDWRLEFQARGGPGYDSCFIIGGNLVAVNTFANNPIKPSAFTQVQLRQSQSPTLLDAEFIRKIVQNKQITDPADGKLKVYDDDNVTILAEGDIFEDAAGVTPYGSSSIKIERREKLE